MPLKAFLVMVGSFDDQNCKKGRENEGRRQDYIFTEKTHERLWLLDGALLGRAVEIVNGAGNNTWDAVLSAGFQTARRLQGRRMTGNAWLPWMNFHPLYPVEATLG